MLADFRRARLTTFAVIFFLGRLATAGPAASSGPVSERIGPSSSKNLRGISVGIERPRAAAPAAYTIHNIGAPPGYYHSTPSGFNNTGQIYGQAYRDLPLGNYVQDCVVWSAGVFRRVPTEKVMTSTGCVASGIDDADATTGNYEIVGSVADDFAIDAYAFAAIAGPAGFKRATTYYAYAPSTMVGVNAAQISAAAAESDRDTAYDVYGLLYATATSASASLTPLQALPSATPPSLHVLAPTYQNPCPFGGCAINDRNEILGYDRSTVNHGLATVAILTVGEPSSLVHLPLEDAVVEDDYFYTRVEPATAYPVAFNDSDQLLYLDAATGAPAIYNITTGVRTIVPVSGAGCSNPTAVPLSMNNHGDVLGTFFLLFDPVYYTWDAVHGTRYLSALLPPNPYTIVPLGINDKGQILVQLTSSAAAISWGTLDPVKTPGSERPRAQSVKQQ